MEKKESKFTEEILRDKVDTLNPLVEWLSENAQETGMILLLGAKEEGADDFHVVAAMSGSGDFNRQILVSVMGKNKIFKDVVLDAAHDVLAHGLTSVIESIARKAEEEKKGGEE